MQNYLVTKRNQRGYLEGGMGIALCGMGVHDCCFIIPSSSDDEGVLKNLKLTWEKNHPTVVANQYYTEMKWQFIVMRHKLVRSFPNLKERRKYLLEEDAKEQHHHHPRVKAALKAAQTKWKKRQSTTLPPTTACCTSAMFQALQSLAKQHTLSRAALVQALLIQGLPMINSKDQLQIVCSADGFKHLIIVLYDDETRQTIEALGQQYGGSLAMIIRTAIALVLQP